MIKHTCQDATASSVRQSKRLQWIVASHAEDKQPGCIRLHERTTPDDLILQEQALRSLEQARMRHKAESASQRVGSTLWAGCAADAGARQRRCRYQRGRGRGAEGTMRPSRCCVRCGPARQQRCEPVQHTTVGRHVSCKQCGGILGCHEHALRSCRFTKGEQLSSDPSSWAELSCLDSHMTVGAACSYRRVRTATTMWARRPVEMAGLRPRDARRGQNGAGRVDVIMAHAISVCCRLPCPE